MRAASRAQRGCCARLRSCRAALIVGSTPAVRFSCGALLAAVAVYSAGGRKALENYSRKKGGSVRLLTAQIDAAKGSVKGNKGR